MDCECKTVKIPALNTPDCAISVVSAGIGGLTPELEESDRRRPLGVMPFFNLLAPVKSVNASVASLAATSF